MASGTWRHALAAACTRLALLVGLVLLAVVAAVGLSVLMYNGRYAATRGGLIFQGVSILGIDVGGLSPDEAREQLMQTLDQSAYPYIALHTAEQRWVVSTRELGGEWQVADAVTEAWMLGRSGVFLDDMVVRLRLLWQRYNVRPSFLLEEGQSLQLLRQVAKQAGHPARRATLRVAGLEAQSGDAQIGREMDVALTRHAIEQALTETSSSSGWGNVAWAWARLRQSSAAADLGASYYVEPIDVAVVFWEIMPPLTEVAGAQESVAAILSEPLFLRAELPELDAQGNVYLRSRSWCIDQAELSTWLTVSGRAESMRVTVDRELIRQRIQSLADDLARRPLEGSFDYDPAAQALITLSPGQVGYALDIEPAIEMVAEACQRQGDERSVVLPVLTYSPRVTRADLLALLPLELIATGESSFSGSTAERLQNIIVATSRFDGVVVAPQSTFSFLSHLGLVTQASGYSLSWVIFGDRTLLGPGGGVCQVSTTCFRAAFWGGYPIVERRPHAYRVSWYEPPLGLDAAVFSPTADMQFRNDTDTPILIKTEVNRANSKLYFRFYGRAPGRTVTLEGPETDNVVPVPEPIYDLDPSLAPGQQVRVEWAHEGLDVRLYRVIEAEGQEPVREEIFSRYEPWAARFRVGPSTAASESAPTAAQ